MATTALALQNNWLSVSYLIGMLSVIYHWSNGLWTAAITWGLTVSTNAQRRWGYVCAVMGIALTMFMSGILFGARTYTVTEAD